MITDIRNIKFFSNIKFLPLRLVFLLVMIISVVPEIIAKPGDKILNRPYADLKPWHLGLDRKSVV